VRRIVTELAARLARRPAQRRRSSLQSRGVSFFWLGALALLHCCAGASHLGTAKDPCACRTRRAALERPSAVPRCHARSLFRVRQRIGALFGAAVRRVWWEWHFFRFKKFQAACYKASKREHMKSERGTWKQPL
jgi:hypothetical protein